MRTNFIQQIQDYGSLIKDFPNWNDFFGTKLFDKEISIIIICCESDIDLGVKKRKRWLNDLRELNINNVEILIILGNKQLDNKKSMYNYNNGILEINCNDYYEGLPEKILASFFYCLNRTTSKIIFKFDVNLEVVNWKNFQITFKKLLYSDCDLFGFIRDVQFGFTRDWHFGKCKDKELNSKYYDRKIKYWPDGGRGYALNRQGIINLFSHILDKKNKFYLSDYIYEDVMVGEILELSTSKFMFIDFMTDFLFDPDKSLNTTLYGNHIKKETSRVEKFFKIFKLKR